ncbi:MAG: redoxin domain-containing protein [Xanthomonadales bacterium]|nr:TlpA family protein disulfide reductase [Xanthomonadales bacterium]NIX12668.1 redoxin domain-containing protein [Xanthomonadales bacterium]
MGADLKGAWKRLRSRYWASLAIDVTIILAAFWLIHAWNTRELPRDRPAPALPALRLDGARAAPQVPEGQAGVVYFFAPWCFYCRHSIDNLDALVDSGAIAWARVVALDYGGPGEVRAFVEETGLRQPVLLGDANTARDWNIHAFPTYFVIGPGGRIDSRSVGYSTWLGLWARSRVVSLQSSAENRQVSTPNPP